MKFLTKDPRLPHIGTQNAATSTGVFLVITHPVDTFMNATSLGVVEPVLESAVIERNPDPNLNQQTLHSQPLAAPIRKRLTANSQSTFGSRNVAIGSVSGNNINSPTDIGIKSDILPPIQAKGLDSKPPTISKAIQTPIQVDLLEKHLENHPDPFFVSKLCRELREGARIGYNGPRVARNSKNLTTAFSKPEIVSANLEKEVKLGCTAGPFTKPPLPNFQVSPIGLVPKKHSEKYRTIFHLSHPKSGGSINSFIAKEDFSLNHVKVDDAVKQIRK